MLQWIISLSFILLMGLSTPTIASSLYFECRDGIVWKVEKPKRTWIGKVSREGVFDRKKGKIEKEWYHNKGSEVYEDRVIINGWYTTAHERCKPKCKLQKVMSLIPMSKRDIIRENLLFWMENEELDINYTKVLKMKTIIASDKCSVDRKKTCKKYTKGDVSYVTFCIPVEPIRFK